VLPAITLAPSAGVVVMAPWAVGSSPLPHSKAGASPEFLARHSSLVTRHYSSVVLPGTRPWPLATFRSSLFTIHSSLFLLVTRHLSLFLVLFTVKRGRPADLQAGLHRPDQNFGPLLRICR
jgi:hypothetical protein